MSAVLQNIQNLVSQPCKHGFVTDIESDVAFNSVVSTSTEADEDPMHAQICNA
jgi:hypothetical protein